MKKIIEGLICLVLSTVPVLAQSGDEGFYTRADVGGIYSTEASLKKGMTVQTGFGQRWGKSFRSEFTLNYTRAVMKGPEAYNGTVGDVKTHLKSWSAMGSVYVDFFADKMYSPYFGAGAGAARNDAADAVADGRQVFGDSRFRFVWKTMAGVGISLPKNLVLDIGYAYADQGRFFTKKVFSSALQQDMKVRQITLGLRYNF